MLITDRDFQETELVQEVLLEVNNIQLAEADKSCTRMAANQPFMMSLLIGYRFDLDEEELEYVLRLILVIYLYFEKSCDILHYQISEGDFEEKHKENIEFLKYFDGEEGDDNKLKLQASNFSNLRCKALFTGVMLILNEQNDLKRMESKTKGIILVGMKALIECLEIKLGVKK